MLVHQLRPLASLGRWREASCSQQLVLHGLSRSRQVHRTVAAAAPEGPGLHGQVHGSAATERDGVMFPLPPTMQLPDGRHVNPDQMIEFLSPFMLDGREDKIEAVVSGRTYAVLPVVEGSYDMGNLAAVCRSADAMGFGAVHVIGNSKKYKQSARTSGGSDKWLHVTVHKEGTREALQAIKDQGFQLVVTHLSKDSVAIQEVDFTKPTAFVLGNERDGVSEDAVALADHCAVIPMTGFVESFNISVAGALIMYEAQQQRVRKLGKNSDLSNWQRKRLKGELMMRSVREGQEVIREMLSRTPMPWQPPVVQRAWEAAHRQEQAAQAPRVE